MKIKCNACGGHGGLDTPEGMARCSECRGSGVIKSDNVVPFNGITSINTDPNLVLNIALKAGLKEVVIVGYDDDGTEYFASSLSDAAGALWHLERGKHSLMKLVDDNMEGINE